ncbi:MAG: DNA cytosine methyltransferase [Xenococcaceae cyanobacterium MO_188.B32]|nr:DNA cytosine methyltransferase [Xenococcaceae cyanobacterium MO_188.B32]
MQSVIQYSLFANNLNLPVYDRSKYLLGNNLRFIDLFAGIGGMRIAWKKVGAKCVFSSEWDKYACKTYQAHTNSH